MKYRLTIDDPTYMVLIMKLLSLTIAISLLSGCTAINYKPSKLALTKNQQSSIMLFYSGISISEKEKLPNNIKDKNVSSIIINIVNNGCYYNKNYQPSQKLAPASIAPIVVAGGKLLFDLAVDKSNKKLENLLKSSSGSYAESLKITNAKDLNSSCIILSRDSIDSNNLSAFTSFKILNENGLIYLLPTNTYAANTIANTKEVKKVNTEQITIIAGFSVQGIATQQNGLPIIATTGQAVSKIGKVTLNSKLHPLNTSEKLGPIPLPSDDISEKSPAIIRISITESGDLGFDVNETIARNKAIKSAIGPAIAEGLKTKLSD